MTSAYRPSRISLKIVLKHETRLDGVCIGHWWRPKCEFFTWKQILDMKPDHSYDTNVFIGDWEVEYYHMLFRAFTVVGIDIGCSTRSKNRLKLLRKIVAHGHIGNCKRPCEICIINDY